MNDITEIKKPFTHTCKHIHGPVSCVESSKRQAHNCTFGSEWFFFFYYFASSIDFEQISCWAVHSGVCIYDFTIRNGYFYSCRLNLCRHTHKHTHALIHIGHQHIIWWKHFIFIFPCSFYFFSSLHCLHCIRMSVNIVPLYLYACKRLIVIDVFPFKFYLRSIFYVSSFDVVYFIFVVSLFASMNI